MSVKKRSHLAAGDAARRAWLAIGSRVERNGRSGTEMARGRSSMPLIVSHELVLWTSVAALLLAAVFAAGLRNSAVAATDPSTIPTNLAVLRAHNGGFPFHVDALLDGRSTVTQDAASWPTLTYLAGEAYRRNGDVDRARWNFSAVATWAASNPYSDTWGGSALAALAMWRWLQILDQDGPSDPTEVDRALHAATILSGTRLYRGMVRADLQPALPLLEEDISKLAAHAAWKNDHPDEAKRWFLDYLSIASSANLDDTDRRIRAELIASGMATPARLELLQNQRLLTLVKTREEKQRGGRKARSPLERSECAARCSRRGGVRIGKLQEIPAQPARGPPDPRLGARARCRLARGTKSALSTCHGSQPGEECERHRRPRRVGVSQRYEGAAAPGS
jgi:hypothetical protein